MNLNGKKWKGRKRMEATKKNNVITIEFEEHDTLQSPMLYQYDTGQKIKFVDVPDGVEVQFSNENSETTDNRILADSQVEIPDFLISEGLEITAYIQYINDQSETTTKVLTIPIECRTKQQDIVPDEDKGAFRRQIEQIMNDTKKAAEEAADKVESNKEFLDKAEKAAEASENSAGKSKEYMDATDANRRTVEGLTEKNKEYATQTESNAESANTSAFNASESASNASQSASNAKGSADNASVSAKEAKDAAVKAGTSESNAKEAESNINSAVTEFEQTKRESITEIGNLTTNSKKEISDLTDAKKTELNKINDDITQNAGELKEAIVNAADAKKEEINQKGLEVLASIPEEFSKVEDTTLIKPTESGAEMLLTDSSDMNIQELHLYGKTEQKTTKGIQLLNLRNSLGKTRGGISYTPNGDGSFKRKGTATSASGDAWLLGNYITEITDKDVLMILEAGKQYFIKDCAVFTGTTIITAGGGRTINVLESEYPEGIKITGIRNPDVVLNRTYDDIIYPLIAESSTAVDWEEYTGEQPSPNPDYPQEIKPCENPTISVAGKNKAKEYEVNKTNKPYTTVLNIDADLEANKEYSLSFIAPKGLWFYFNENLFAYDLKQATGKYQTVKLKTVATLSKNNANQFDKSLQKWIILKTDAKNTLVADFEKVQLEKGNVGTEYEEYKEIQMAQPICELNGINDIKDELIVRADGTGQLIQKWKRRIIDDSVSLYIDINPKHEVGVLINILAYRDATNTQSNLYSLIYSDKLTAIKNIYDEDAVGIGYTTTSDYVRLRLPVSIGTTDEEIKNYLEQNPIEILYLLKEPIVTNLSAEEVQKILALHTNKPNTTIWNDQNAEMQITYVADTKTYIDNKMAELQALLLEKGE